MECTPHGADDTANLPPDGPEAETLLAEIKEMKHTYQQNMEKLKQAKEQIVTYQKLAEQNKDRLQQDFEAWYMSLQRAEGNPECTHPDATPIVANDPVPSQSGSAPRGRLSSSQTPAPLDAVSRPPSGADMEPLRSSMSSQASSADSFARVTPKRMPSPARGPTASLTSLPSAAPAGAWDAPRLQSAGSTKGRPPRLHPSSDDPRTAASPGGAAVGCGNTAASRQRAASPSRKTPQPTSTPTALTGDAQTDSDIAAYYAAFAELQS